MRLEISAFVETDLDVGHYAILFASWRTLCVSSAWFTAGGIFRT
jgi:hypothetical protein